MKILANLFCLIILSFSKSILANHYSSIDYKITPLNDLNMPAVKVDVEIKGTLSDKIILDLPHAWAGVNYTDQIKHITVLDLKNPFKIIKNKDKHQLILTISNINHLRLSYELHQKKGNPSNVHEAIIHQDLIHTPGYGLFAYPHDLKWTRKIPFTVAWQSIPKNWQTISDHGIQQTLNFSGTLFQLLHSLYVAGNIRRHQIAEKAAPVYLSLYGEFDLTDKDIIDFVNEITESQRAFFKDSDFPYYAISLIEV